MLKMEKWKFIAMVFCLFMAGCSDDDDPVVLTPEKTVVTLSGEGDSQSVAVTCNGQWTAVSSQEWCKVTAKEAAVVISAEENQTGTELKADVTLTSGDVKAVIKVTQGVPTAPINSVFAQTSEHWYFDFDGLAGAYKAAYEASKESLVAQGWQPGGAGYALQWVNITQDTLAFMIYDEDYKNMGAPQEMYAYPGVLLITIETVAGTRDQVVFKGIKVDPEAGEEDFGEYWYESETWGNRDFRAFINTLMAQKYSIAADDASAPQVLIFTGVTDAGSVFKLKLQE